jgi:D-lactate dehydrogenase (cytochrome)
MFNTGCSGTNAVRYGTVSHTLIPHISGILIEAQAKAEWFLNATIVLPSGEVIKTRQRARKSSAGFDTTKLFIGSEGTLGIVTELTVRLTPLLPTTVAIVAFPDVRAAVKASTAIVNAVGAGIQCIELVDDMYMRATNMYGGNYLIFFVKSREFTLRAASKTKYPEKDSVFIKFQGPTDCAMKEASEIARGIAEKNGGSSFKMASSKEEAEELWQDRKNALWSGMALSPGAKAWSTDVCVPVSRLPDLVLETKADIQKSGIISSIVGHVGDGNFHSLLLFHDDKQRALCADLVHRMVDRAIDMDGTCTGEHGVGMGKKEFLNRELGSGTVAFMKMLKRTIDPKGIMNPGKVSRVKTYVK